MNTPSLELCKKLKEIGYEWDNVTYVYDEQWMLWHMSELMISWLPDVHWIAPTVAEMIDFLPEVIRTKNWDAYFFCDKSYCYYMIPQWWGIYEIHDDFRSIYWKLPRSLAEMIILLHKKGFIFFDK